MKRIHMISSVIVALGVGGAFGGGDAPVKPKGQVASRPLSEAEVLSIARKALEKNDTWADRAEFEKPQRTSDDQWLVFVRRLPYAIGGDRTIYIDARGKVVGYFRGM